MSVYIIYKYTGISLDYTFALKRRRRGLDLRKAHIGLIHLFPLFVCAEKSLLTEYICVTA